MPIVEIGTFANAVPADKGSAEKSKVEGDCLLVDSTSIADAVCSGEAKDVGAI